MNPRSRRLAIFFTPYLFLLLAVRVDCGFYKMMSEAMGWNDPWESKGVTFGIKSKGMTAIIPIPLPIPIFTKSKMSMDKGDAGGSTSNGNTKGGDKGGGGGGGWEPPMGGNDWWK